MTKRAPGQFGRAALDYYPTPAAAVVPLIPHLRRTRVKTFAEPCYGEGSLREHLDAEGFVCIVHGDLKDGFDAGSPAAWSKSDYVDVDAVITNPPWDKKEMHRIMQHQCIFKPSWFLIYSDWLFTKQSAHIMAHFCTDIVPIGRVKWFPDSASVGFDNCCWVCMNALKDSQTIFWPMTK
jgi:hypothetical protein